jgi:predicted Zn-dependent protease
VVAKTLHTWHSFGWAPLRSIRQKNFKYIEAPRAELYDLAADPGETRNLVAARPADVRRLRQELRQTLARYAPKPASPAATVASAGPALRSLGYLAPGPKRRTPTAAADPKDRLPIFRLYEQAMRELADGQPARARATLGRLLAADPGNILARRELGGVYLQQKQYEPAREALERVARLAPDDYPTRFQLGLTYLRLGRREAAIQELEHACRLSPGATQCREELEKARAAGAAASSR